MATTATFRIWRGEGQSGKFEDYPTDVSEGMVVLDLVHHVQAEQANDLAVRWNCKAGKCGSRSADGNGAPRVVCRRRPRGKRSTSERMTSLPPIRDRVTDGSGKYRVMKGIKPLKPRAPDAPDGT